MIITIAITLLLLVDFTNGELLASSPKQGLPSAVQVASPDYRQGPGVTILQGDITLRPGKRFEFTADVIGAPTQEVTWMIQEGTFGGLISSSGLSSAVYMAPHSPGIYHIAAANAALSMSDTIKVTVVDGVPPWVNITPPSISRDTSAMIIASSPSKPTTIYLGTSGQGVWKSINSGRTWYKANVGQPSRSSIYFANDGTPAGKGGGCSGIEHLNWGLAVDPTNANVVYVADGYGCAQGLWKSTDGGATWRQMFSDVVMQQSTNDIGPITIDPKDHLHVLVASHSSWKGASGGAGVWESNDGGVTWILHRLPKDAGSTNHVAEFIDSSTWIVATQDGGIWRTLDSGEHWIKVSDYGKAHGGSAMYRANNGVLYLGVDHRVLRSTDNGLTWRDAGAPVNQDGYMSIVGDGKLMCTATGNTGQSTIGPVQYYCSLETDGTGWTPYNAQTFANGPMSMIFDPKSGIIHSSNWLAGVWKAVVDR